MSQGRKPAGRPDASWRVWLTSKPKIGAIFRYGNAFVEVMDQSEWRNSSTGHLTTIIIWRHVKDKRIGTSGRRAHSINWSWTRKLAHLPEAERLEEIKRQLDEWFQKREDDW